VLFRSGAVPQMPVEARWPLLIGCGFLTLLGWLGWRYKDPAEARPRRLGGTMYLLPFSVMLAFGLLQMYGPARPKFTEAQIAVAMVEGATKGWLAPRIAVTRSLPRRASRSSRRMRTRSRA